jgi:hypothetical protein
MEDQQQRQVKAGDRLRIGDRIVTVDRVDNGVPVIKAQCETIKHADGRQDVVVNVPCLTIQSAQT